MMINHGSFFSGIGGFDLACEMLGFRNVFHCEKNKFCQRILNYYWPQAILYEDIKETDFTQWRGLIQLVTGGFPCQPFSSAGKRQGTEDDRHLWPEQLRALKQIQPCGFLGENVRGITNWSKGLVFDQVQADLEAEGYEVLPFLLPACSVNAPHIRDRIWFIAYSESNRNRRRLLRMERENEEQQARKKSGQNNSGFSNDGKEWDAADSKRIRMERYRSAWQQISQTPTGTQLLGRNGAGDYWAEWPTQSPIRERDDGISDRMDRYITKELENEISKTSEENRIENLSELWNHISSQEIWEKVRRFYSLESKTVLFKTMQLYQREYQRQVEFSPFGEKFCEPILRDLRKHGEFRRSSQGQKLEKQRPKQLADVMPLLPHEVALAAGRFEAAIAKFESWHRNESLKGYGNAIVPQVAVQILKVFEQWLKDE